MKEIGQCKSRPWRTFGCDVLSTAYAFCFSMSMPLKMLCRGIASCVSAAFTTTQGGCSLIQTFEAVGSQKVSKD